MEPVTDAEQKKSVWLDVTPLSKYLAMILFIMLPFIGGWIGYTYAPERVIEVVEKDRIVEKEIPDKGSEELLNNKNPSYPEKVFTKDGRYAPDGLMLSDIEMYQQTGLPYVTTFSEEHSLYTLGGKYSDTTTIYKYNKNTQTYEPLGINIVETLDAIDIHRSGFGLVLRGWSSDLRYLMFTFAYDLYYLDTENLGNGVIKVDGIRAAISNGSSEYNTGVSSDRKQILAVADLDHPRDLYIFDINTRTPKKVYTLDDPTLTFMNFNAYDGVNYIYGSWYDDDTVRLEISSQEEFKKYVTVASGSYEESSKRFEQNLKTVFVEID
jgi:hypothetical protein